MDGQHEKYHHYLIESIKNNTKIELKFTGDINLAQFRRCDPKMFYFHNQYNDNHLVATYALKRFIDYEFEELEPQDKLKSLDLFTFNVRLSNSSAYSTSNYQMFLIKDPEMSVNRLSERCSSLVKQLIGSTCRGECKRKSLPSEIDESFLIPTNKEFSSMQRREISQNYMKLFSFDLKNHQGCLSKLGRDDFIQILLGLNDFFSSFEDKDILQRQFFQSYNYYSIGDLFRVPYSDPYEMDFKDRFFLVPENSTKYFNKKLLGAFINLKNRKKFPLEFKIDLQIFDTHRFTISKKKNRGLRGIPFIL
ncbi:hypothetical protein WICMUC_005092 [Wickerhamomyces mucosus]|uniref:Uncharacterized protein n=1 Tax=Wickerhamomyces mucosus TaxID=1378264 RepID=A0A9P8PBB8_9ASCO|nr:hypothetical protein WICMUC_005092 [Wickerhamomyces mucosus]